MSAASRTVSVGLSGSEWNIAAAMLMTSTGFRNVGSSIGSQVHRTWATSLLVVPDSVAVRQWQRRCQLFLRGTPRFSAVRDAVWRLDASGVGDIDLSAYRSTGRSATAEQGGRDMSGLRRPPPPRLGRIRRV